MLNGTFQSTGGINFFMGFCPNSRLFWPAGKVCDFSNLCYSIDPSGKGSLHSYILSFVVFEILFGQLIDRMLKNKSLHKRKAPPPRPAMRVHLCHIFLALPVKNGPLPAELKFRKNTGYCVITLFWKITKTTVPVAIFQLLFKNSN